MPKRSCSRCGLPCGDLAGDLRAVPGNELGDYTHAACFDLAMKQVEERYHARLKGHAWDVFDLLGHLAREETTCGKVARELLETIRGERTNDD